MSKHKDTVIVDDFTVTNFGIQTGLPGELVNVHSATLCTGRPCVIHNPSDHHMRAWKTNWRGDKGVLERICPHGIGHPDPDDLEYYRESGQQCKSVHGCDGCCFG